MILVNTDQDVHFKDAHPVFLWYYLHMEEWDMNTKKRALGLKPAMVHLLVFFLILMFLMMMAMLRNIREVRSVAYECMEDKTSLYVELIGKDIENLSTEFLVMRVRDNKDLLALPESITPQESRYYRLQKDIMDANFTKRMVYEKKYKFYEYVHSADFLILDSGVYFSTSNLSEEALALKEKLNTLVTEDRAGVVWDFFEADGCDYLYGALQQEGRAVGCIIKLDDLFAGIEITNLGYEGIPFFEKNGKIYMGSQSKGREDIMDLINLTDHQNVITNDYAFYQYPLKRVGDLEILMVFTNGVLDRIFNIQTLLLVGYLVLTALAMQILLYFYQRILKPMRTFVNGLKNPEKEQWLSDTSLNSIVELEYANERFKEQFRELQSLRIALYEKELMEKKTELEYVQEQIRPHFYLNCLSIIQSMAEMSHAENIVQITDKLSGYMRYVMKDSFELRSIRDELEHIQGYVDIQNIRRPGVFTYEAIVDDEVQELLIPPLVLQTFVENSVSHALISDGHIEITLYMTLEQIDGRKSLYITVSDTGPGFPEKILEAIEKKEPIVFNGRKHIGIQNTIKRLDILYGNQASVHLSNMAEHYGAVAEIVMPAVTPDEKGE